LAQPLAEKYGALGIGKKRLQGQRGKFISPFPIGFG